MEKCKENDSIVNEAAVRRKYEALTLALINSRVCVTTMESCTAGQVASLLTDTEGASAILKGAFVTYSNEMKIKTGVPEDVIARFGVYSAETAAAMAEVSKRIMGADIGIGVTGSFGNKDPDNADSRPGEAWFAVAAEDQTKTFHCTVPPQPSRLLYKLYLADRIADRVLAALSEMAH